MKNGNTNNECSNSIDQPNISTHHESKQNDPMSMDFSQVQSSDPAVQLLIPNESNAKEAI